MPLPTFQTYKATLAAGESSKYAVLGNFVTSIAQSGDLRISWDEGTATGVLAQGLTVKTDAGEEYKNFILTNEGTSPVTYEIYAGRGDVKDSRLSLGATAIPAATNKKVLQAHGDAVVKNPVLVISGAAGQESFMIRNLSPTENIWMGSSNAVSTGTGFPIGPGEVYEGDGSFPVWVRANISNVSVRYWRLGNI